MHVWTLQHEQSYNGGSTWKTSCTSHVAISTSWLHHVMLARPTIANPATFPRQGHTVCSFSLRLVNMQIRALAKCSCSSIQLHRPHAFGYSVIGNFWAHRLLVRVPANHTCQADSGISHKLSGTIQFLLRFHLLHNSQQGCFMLPCPAALGPDALTAERVSQQ